MALGHRSNLRSKPLYCVVFLPPPPSRLTLTDRSLVKVAQGCAHINKLLLKGCVEVTSATVLALALHCPMLQLLDLSGCDRISEQTVVAASRSLRYVASLCFWPLLAHPSVLVLAEEVSSCASPTHLHGVVRFRYADTAQSFFGLRPHNRRGLLFEQARHKAIGGAAALAIQTVWRGRCVVCVWRGGARVSVCACLL